MNSQTTILLVDDEEEFVTTLAERLEIRGFKAEAATSGKQAMEIIEKKSFDVAALDVKMPGMDGLQLMEKIKDRHPGLPVLLLTGYGAASEGEKGMSKGAYDYLMKPVDIEELISKVHEAIANKSS
ncbi:MAG: response regulator [Desulfobacterales bacterium]